VLPRCRERRRGTGRSEAPGVRQRRAARISWVLTGSTSLVDLCGRDLLGSKERRRRADAESACPSTQGVAAGSRSKFHKIAEFACSLTAGDPVWAGRIA